MATVTAAWHTGDTRLSWWERCSFELARVVVRLLVRTSSLNGLYHFGRFFATLEWLINYKRRRRFARSLARVAGGRVSAAERRRQTWRHFVRTRCDKLFYLVLDHLDPVQVGERFEIVNRHLIDDALARGRGVYVAMSHLGAHHVVAMLFVGLGYKVAVGRDERVGAMRRFIQLKYDRKKRQRAEYFYSNSYPRVIYRYFQNNYVVGSAIDVSRVRAEHLRTIDVTVFGERRPFLSGPMHVAVRCGAPVLQGFVLSRKYFRYVLVLHGPLIDPAQPTETNQTLEVAMRAYAANVERLTRRYPCHLSKI